MRRRFVGLHSTDCPADALEGAFLVEVERAFFTPNGQKPFFTVRFRVLEPVEAVGRTFAGRLYASEKALWKLSWFLHDFGYDDELYAKDEIDDKALIGLKGVVKVSNRRTNGRSYSSLDAFAPVSAWGIVEEPPDSALSA